MTVEIKRLEARRMLRVRHLGPYSECGSAWERLMPFAGRHGLFGPHTVCFGLSHDDPQKTPPEEIRYDACISVPDDFVAEPPFELFDFEGGEYAATLHRGSYAGLAQAYDLLHCEWLPKSGRELRAGPCVEVYLNWPHEVAPEELRTEVLMPLE
ncbi:MAG: GyrI-like domain-containing protein [Planctomycetes bacterium]|nr:GyrI-like domain-containing protein [Planctomycetota bacterium]